MRRSTTYLTPLFITTLVLIAGCSLLKTTPFEEPGKAGEPGVFIYDDFSEYEVGEQPSLWTIIGGVEYLYVDEAPELASGKAVRIHSDPSRTHTQMSKELPAEAADVVTLIIDMKIKHTEGRNNVYVTKDDSHRLHWWVESNGQFRFNRRTDDGGLSAVTVGMLQSGWNHMRLVANIESEEVTLYLNDMETPLATYTYGRSIDTWAGASFMIAHPHSADSPRDIMYGDIKVWTEM